MFHVKHAYFAGLKTLILSNTACLEPSFALRSEPAQICSRSCRPATIDTINSSPLQSPRKFSPRSPNSLSSLSRDSSMAIQQDNTRELLSRSIPSSIKSRRSLHLNARVSNVSHHFEHAYRGHPYFCRQQIHSRKQNRQAHENASHAFIGQPRKNRQNLDKHCLFVAVSRKTSP